MQDLEPVPIYCSSNVQTHLNDMVEVDCVLAATRASHFIYKSEINLKIKIYKKFVHNLVEMAIVAKNAYAQKQSFPVKSLKMNKLKIFLQVIEKYTGVQPVFRIRKFFGQPISRSGSVTSCPYLTPHPNPSINKKIRKQP